MLPNISLLFSINGSAGGLTVSNKERMEETNRVQILGRITTASVGVVVRCLFVALLVSRAAVRAFLDV